MTLNNYNFITSIEAIVSKCTGSSSFKKLDNVICIKKLYKLIMKIKDIEPVYIFIMILNFLEKICKILYINGENLDTIVCLLFLLTNKYLIEHSVHNDFSEIAEICGVNIEDYISYEVELLKHLDWNLNISNKEINSIYSKILIYSD